jgi:hypothetical protein
MDQRDECFRIRHSTPLAPETQTGWVEFVLYWTKQGAFLFLILLAIYSLLSA